MKFFPSLPLWLSPIFTVKARSLPSVDEEKRVDKTSAPGCQPQERPCPPDHRPVANVIKLFTVVSHDFS